jgi:hypothetical protein
MLWVMDKHPRSSYQLQFNSMSRRARQTFRVRCEWLCRVVLQFVAAKPFQVDARGQSPILADSANMCPTKSLPGADQGNHSPDLNLECLL